MGSMAADKNYKCDEVGFISDGNRLAGVFIGYSSQVARAYPLRGTSVGSLAWSRT